MRAILFLILLANITSYSQDMRIISNQEPIHNLAKYGNCFGCKAENWEWFNEFNKQTSTSQLLSLVENEDPTVQCYSFAALVKREHPTSFQILCKNLENTREMSSDQGCIFVTLTARNVMLNTFYCSSKAFDESQQDFIDSSLIFTRINDSDTVPNYQNSGFSELKSYALSHISSKPHYYKRIKELAHKHKIHTAIVPLAKYQKQSDIATILSSSGHLLDEEETRLKAMYYFPDTAFYPYLKKTYETIVRNENRLEHTTELLFNTLALYETSETFELFNELTSHEDFILRMALYDALIDKPYFKSIFDQIHFNIK